MTLGGRRVLVTGAARGIGLAVAEAAREAGAAVALSDIDEGPLREAAARLGVPGVVMDVSDDASAQAGVRAAAEALGGLDGLVNNAAVLDEAHAATVTSERFRRVLDVNLASILRVTQAALPWLGTAGAVVNTLSVQSFLAPPSSAAYATAKGGGLMLTRAMAVDLAPLRVNAVAPGFIDTRMAVQGDGTHEHQTEWFRLAYVEKGRIPLRRAGTPSDCAGAFVFLLSDAAAYVTGQCLAVDGGLTVTA